MARPLDRPAGYSVGAFAQQLAISRSGVYNLIKAGEVRSVKIGGRRIIPATEIDRLLDVDADAE